MKRFTILFLVFTSASFLSAQITPCGQAEVTNSWLDKHPALKKNYEQIQTEKLTLHENTKKEGMLDNTTGAVYTIPVVFHVLHLGGPENISDAQIIDQVAILNRDFQKKNADTSVIVPAFKNNIGNVGFEFKLAKIDPDGNCTNGITRHYTKKTFWNTDNLGDFTYSWPNNKYLNIYIVSTTSIGAQAYTFLPGIGIPDSADAIVCMHQFCGSIGTSSVSNSRVLTHEVAHWFDIQHIWGTSNTPGVTCGDDMVNDTPVTKGFSSCSTNATKVCDPNIEENVQNYMDYSPCKIMFTNGQAQRMITTINSSVNSRNNLSTPTNLAETGVSGTVICSTLADFYSTKTNNCAGASFTFNSLSQFGDSAGTVLWSFPGGVPSSSTKPVETVIYPNPGLYTVSLTATGLNGSDTEIKTDFINAINGSNGLKPTQLYHFEDAMLLSGLNIVNGQNGSIKWEQNTAVGANGTNQCIFLDNFPDSANTGSRDYFETPYFDFTNTKNIGLSYYYAYAKKYTNQVDSCKVEYSLDCGVSWSTFAGTPTANVMAANSGGTKNVPFIPSSTQWKQVNIPGAFLSNLSNKPSVKFRFLFKSDPKLNGANNLYIDQINISGTPVGIAEELENEIDLKIFPNPTSGLATIRFKSINSPQINISDMLGKGVNVSLIATNSGYLTYELNPNGQLPKGVYLVKIQMGDTMISKKLIIV